MKSTESTRGGTVPFGGERRWGEVGGSRGEGSGWPERCGGEETGGAERCLGEETSGAERCLGGDERGGAVPR